MKDQAGHRLGKRRAVRAAAVAALGLITFGAAADRAFAQVCEPAAVFRSGVVRDTGGAGFPCTDGRIYILPIKRLTLSAPSLIALYDVSNPVAPVLLSKSEVVGSPQAAWVGGDLAVVVGTAGLTTLDISDPSAPMPLGTTTLPGARVAVSGDVAFVLLDVGLAAVDIADPTSPTFLGSLEIPGSSRGLALEGGIALVAAGVEGLRVVDISDPQAMVEVAALTIAGAEAVSVAVQAGLASVGTWKVVPGSVVGAGSVVLVDVSDPRAPATLATFDVGAPVHDVVMAGSLVLAGTSGWVGSRLPLSEVIALDVAEPAEPAQLGRAALPRGAEILQAPLLNLNGRFAHFLTLHVNGIGGGSTFEFGTLDISLCQCYADCDSSGGLDFFDFLCFQNMFAAANPLADCDRSEALDLFDFLCFQNEFTAGCP